MDIPHARADTEVVARLVQGGEHLHAVAGSLDGGDIRVEVADRTDELVELGVAHVGVDLSLRSHAGGSQAEGAHGPLQVRRLLSLAQRQQLADGWLVDLNNLRTSGDEVVDLVAQRQGNLVGGLAQRLVVADEGPREHRHRTGEHALDRLVGQLLGLLEPGDSHRLRTTDVAEQDWRTDAAGTVGLHPRVLGGVVALQLLGEVLHHVVALRLTVDEDVQVQLLLALDDVRDLVAHRLGVLLLSDLALAQLRARLADLGGLREGADRGGRQRREVQLLLLGLATLLDVTSVAVLLGDLGGALADLVVVGQLGGRAGLHGLAGLGQRLLVGLGALAAQDAGEQGDLADLLLAECQPAAQLVAQGGLAGQGVRHVQQGRGGGDGDRAALGQRLQGLQGSVQVGAPDVAAVDDAGDQQLFAGPAR